MIKVKIEKNGKFIKCINITGHADYDKYGKDIVCASVSSIVITSCNLAIKLNENALKVIQEEGLINVEVLKEEQTINKVLENMIDMLKELSNDYEKNIKII